MLLVSAFVRVVGDVMGPALANLNNLLNMPYGCGEQNMVKFAPNIYVLKYLQAKGLDTAKVQSKAVKYMKSGTLYEAGVYSDKVYHILTSHLLYAVISRIPEAAQLRSFRWFIQFIRAIAIL